ncbi:hypothetical protein BBK36DRAFT_1144600 [Trichoderma citrinoviride]|uniref:Uncharacterized protein n=1 Tax=Trichoderma citrinoviride TaxID=58853 RepID=A0A2T4AZU0_9HYPO|nr:hypothetical protein BBK36DRAFT_1144600 [Trichoderma citrinoviride]PTB62589.1 hypothetical protein BBK36DRAFT_1144600 [Trichoderma citrinoviride]
MQQRSRELPGSWVLGPEGALGAGSRGNQLLYLYREGFKGCPPGPGRYKNMPKRWNTCRRDGVWAAESNKSCLAADDACDDAEHLLVTCNILCRYYNTLSKRAAATECDATLNPGGAVSTSDEREGLEPRNQVDVREPVCTDTTSLTGRRGGQTSWIRLAEMVSIGAEAQVRRASWGAALDAKQGT